MQWGSLAIPVHCIGHSSALHRPFQCTGMDLAIYLIISDRLLAMSVFLHNTTNDYRKRHLSSYYYLLAFLSKAENIDTSAGELSTV